MTPGAVNRAELPSNVTEAVIAALKTGNDPATVLPRRWRGFQTGISSQAEPEIVELAGVGADLHLVVEPDDARNRDRVRIMVDRLDQLSATIGYLPAGDDLARALKRGWVRCWFAGIRPTQRHGSGAGIVFVAIYDP